MHIQLMYGIMSHSKLAVTKPRNCDAVLETEPLLVGP